MNLRNKDGLQPLHSAVLSNHGEVVTALLRLGANPLATCPDMYPSYAKWRLTRGLQAMQVRWGGVGWGWVLSRDC